MVPSGELCNVPFSTLKNIGLRVLRTFAFNISLNCDNWSRKKKINKNKINNKTPTTIL